MKLFMSNRCSMTHCVNANCKDCSLYNPHFKGIKVPKWLGNILYDIEFKIYYIANRKKILNKANEFSKKFKLK